MSQQPNTTEMFINNSCKLLKARSKYRGRFKQNKIGKIFKNRLFKITKQLKELLKIHLVIIN